MIVNFLSVFEDRVAGIFGAARAPFSFKKLAKQAAHEMEDATLVVNGVNTAPALYTILISGDDDSFMAPYYPELSNEVSEFVKAQAEKKRYVFVGEPLVRFMIDPELKAGRFSVFAENVDAPTLGRLYEEERAYQKGLAQNFRNNEAMNRSKEAPMPRQQPRADQGMPAPANVARPAMRPLPLVDAGNAGAAGAAAGAAAGVASNLASAPVDPFAPSMPDPAQPIPVPKTITREAMAGVGGAAATGAALGVASVASNMASTRNPSPVQATAQLVDVVTGDTFEVTGPVCIVGRERAVSNVALRDPNVSRRHAQLMATGSDWSIEDLNSTNGTLVNNRRITRCPLRNGDLLTFGLSTFEFRS